MDVGVVDVHRGWGCKTKSGDKNNSKMCMQTWKRVRTGLFFFSFFRYYLTAHAKLE